MITSTTELSLIRTAKMRSSFVFIQKCVCESDCADIIEVIGLYFFSAVVDTLLTLNVWPKRSRHHSKQLIN